MRSAFSPLCRLAKRPPLPFYNKLSGSQSQFKSCKMWHNKTAVLLLPVFIAVRIFTDIPLLLRNLATDYLPRICLRGNLFTNPLPGNALTCHNIRWLGDEPIARPLPATYTNANTHSCGQLDSILWHL
jgi:hypothetical protein